MADEFMIAPGIEITDTVTLTPEEIAERRYQEEIRQQELALAAQLMGDPAFYDPYAGLSDDVRFAMEQDALLAGRAGLVGGYENLPVTQGGGFFEPLASFVPREVRDFTDQASDVFIQTHLPHVEFLSPELLGHESVVHDTREQIYEQLPTWAQNVADFEEINFNYIYDTLRTNPERIFYGSFDPLSTAMWNEILGTEHAPVINQLGGPSESAFIIAESQGVDTSVSRISHEVAGAIAGAIGGGAAAEALAPLLAQGSQAVAGAVGEALSPTVETALATSSSAGSSLISAGTLAPVIVTGSSIPISAAVGAALGAAAGGSLATGASVVDVPTADVPSTELPVSDAPILEAVEVVGQGSMSPILSATGSGIGVGLGMEVPSPSVEPSPAVESQPTAETTAQDDGFLSESWWSDQLRRRGLPYVTGLLNQYVSSGVIPAEQHDEWSAYLNDLAAREGVTGSQGFSFPLGLGLIGALVALLN